MVESYVIPEDKRLLVAVCYVFTLLGGIILLLIAENNKALKFHALQNIVLGVIIVVLSAVSFCFAGVLGILFWIYCLYGAYLIYSKGDFRSIVADFVEKSLMK